MYVKMFVNMVAYFDTPQKKEEEDTINSRNEEHFFYENVRFLITLFINAYTNTIIHKLSLILILIL